MVIPYKLTIFPMSSQYEILVEFPKIFHSNKGPLRNKFCYIKRLKMNIHGMHKFLLDYDNYD